MKKNIVTQKHGKITYLGSRTSEPIATKFCKSDAVYDVMTHANFGEDRLRGFYMVRGRILAFSIDLFRRIYSTLALPCE